MRKQLHQPQSPIPKTTPKENFRKTSQTTHYRSTHNRTTSNHHHIIKSTMNYTTHVSRRTPCVNIKCIKQHPHSKTTHGFDLHNFLLHANNDYVFICTERVPVTKDTRITLGHKKRSDHGNGWCADGAGIALPMYHQTFDFTTHNLHPENWLRYSQVKIVVFSCEKYAFREAFTLRPFNYIV